MQGKIVIFKQLGLRNIAVTNGFKRGAADVVNADPTRTLIRA
jgi:hypothetical protein